LEVSAKGPKYNTVQVQDGEIVVQEGSIGVGTQRSERSACGSPSAGASGSLAPKARNTWTSMDGACGPLPDSAYQCYQENGFHKEGFHKKEALNILIGDSEL